MKVLKVFIVGLVLLNGLCASCDCDDLVQRLSPLCRCHKRSKRDIGPFNRPVYYYPPMAYPQYQPRPTGNFAEYRKRGIPNHSPYDSDTVSYMDLGFYQSPNAREAEENRIVILDHIKETEFHLMECMKLYVELTHTLAQKKKNSEVNELEALRDRLQRQCFHTERLLKQSNEEIVKNIPTRKQFKTQKFTNAEVTNNSILDITLPSSTTQRNIRMGMDTAITEQNISLNQQSLDESSEKDTPTKHSKTSKPFSSKLNVTEHRRLNDSTSLNLNDEIKSKPDRKSTSYITEMPKSLVTQNQWETNSEFTSTSSFDITSSDTGSTNQMGDSTDADQKTDKTFQSRKSMNPLKTEAKSSSKESKEKEFGLKALVNMFEDNDIFTEKTTTPFDVLNDLIKLPERFINQQIDLTEESNKLDMSTTDSSISSQERHSQSVEFRSRADSFRPPNESPQQNNISTESTIAEGYTTPKREKLNENEIHIPKIVTTEKPSGRTLTTIDGTETIPNNDFTTETDIPRRSYSDNERKPTTNIMENFTEQSTTISSEVINKANSATFVNRNAQQTNTLKSSTSTVNNILDDFSDITRRPVMVEDEINRTTQEDNQHSIKSEMIVEDNFTSAIPEEEIITSQQSEVTVNNRMSKTDDITRTPCNLIDNSARETSDDSESCGSSSDQITRVTPTVTVMATSSESSSESESGETIIIASTVPTTFEIIPTTILDTSSTRRQGDFRFDENSESIQSIQRFLPFLNGKMLFKNQHHYIPIHFVQTRKGELTLSLDGTNICNRLQKERSSIMLAALCAYAKYEGDKL